MYYVTFDVTADRGKSRLFIPIKFLIALRREFTIARIKVAV